MTENLDTQPQLTARLAGRTRDQLEILLPRKKGRMKLGPLRSGVHRPSPLAHSAS